MASVLHSTHFELSHFCLERYLCDFYRNHALFQLQLHYYSILTRSDSLKAQKIKKCFELIQPFIHVYAENWVFINSQQ